TCPCLRPARQWGPCAANPGSWLDWRSFKGFSNPHDSGILQVSMQYNPGWNNSSVNLLHVRAVGPSDTLHYIWSSIGAPAVLLVATESRTSSLGINWTQLLSSAPAGAIWIDPPSSIIYSTAVVFTKVPLRKVSRSVSAAAKQPLELFYPTYDLSDFSWDSVNHTLNHTALMAEFTGTPAADPSGSFSNGSLAFRVTAYEASGRDRPLPSLLHTANSSKVEFVLAGVAPRGNSSQFVLEVATVEETGVVQKLRSARSIDDEYTPTIFEVSVGGPMASWLVPALAWPAGTGKGCDPWAQHWGGRPSMSGFSLGPLTPKRPLNDSSVSREGQRSWCRVWSTGLMGSG
uniref:Glycosylated lysosomal membrane protein n=1 Tax=Strix occidentalis caurina TaxID=311401 RepID=A0A8D0F057_STROC